MISVIGALAAVLVLAPLSYSEPPPNPPLKDSQEFLSQIKDDEEAGLLTIDQALLINFQYIFAPTELPLRYRVVVYSPLKCGTDLIRRYLLMKDDLDPQISRLIEGYLSIPDSRLSFISTEGHFILSYALEGDNAISGQDVDPANGIPDFVEKAGQYLEHAWTVEVLMTGFEDPLPVDAPYHVSFRAMQNYGYINVEDEDLGTTSIVLHNSYEGFPPNDDPEGEVWGACKVTAAHEFKHASQYVGSRWTEDGWIELDAVWAEELVFDQTNDYYNYLIGGSPIRHPETPLDGGSTGTGSYEDCVFQIWLQETWGAGLIVDFWRHRMNHPAEPVFDSYAAVLEDLGQDLPGAWGQFTGWNYATGYRALPMVGYDEASHYPYGPVVDTLSDYPAEYSGSVEHLAANFVRLLGFDEEVSGQLFVEFTCQPGNAPMTLTLVLAKNDGSGLVETIPVQGDNQVEQVVAVPLQEIQAAGLVIGNPDQNGLARPYELTVRRIISVPEPILSLETNSVEFQVPVGGTAQAYALIGNEGEDQSTLHYQASVWATDPGEAITGASVSGKSIGGSSLMIDQTTYQAGATHLLNLTVTNGSTDDEWLTDVQLAFPAGVGVITATPFSGGSLGDLIWNEAAGDGVATAWHGEYGSQGYGVIRDGESATAQVEVTIAPDFSGLLEIDGTITGDQFGDNPHVVVVSVALTQFNPQLEITGPEAGQLVPLGSALAVTWDQDGTLATVQVSLSRDGGQTWEDLAEVPADQEALSVSVGGAASINCLARVASLDGLVSSVSPGNFTIYPAAGWLTCEPAAGSVSAGHLGAIILECDASDLDPGGEETAWLMVQHDGPGGPGVIPVMVQVNSVVATGELTPITGLTGNFPNPFNPVTIIRFTLAEEADCSLEILDLRGRLVRRLLAGPRLPGRYRARWDGTDGAGQPQAAGVYLVRLGAGAFTATEKIMLAK